MLFLLYTQMAFIKWNIRTKGEIYTRAITKLIILKRSNGATKLLRSLIRYVLFAEKRNNYRLFVKNHSTNYKKMLSIE